MIIVILTLHICTTACSGDAMLLMLRLWQSGWELIGIYMDIWDPRGNFHSRTGEPVHSLNEILNVLEF